MERPSGELPLLERPRYDGGCEVRIARTPCQLWPGTAGNSLSAASVLAAADPIPPLFTLFPLVWTRQHEVSRFRGFERTRAAQFTSASIEKEKRVTGAIGALVSPVHTTGQVLELSRGDTRFCTLTRAQVGRVASS